MDQKIKLINPVSWGWHRSGMAPVHQALQSLCAPNGILCIDAEEKLYLQDYQEPHILISHFTPQTPKPCPYNLNALLGSEAWKRHVTNCRGIICFSQYCANYVREKTGILTSHLCHPVTPAEKKFVFEKFDKNRKIVQLGHWLRMPRRFAKLDCPYRKIALVGDPDVRKTVYLPEFTDKMEIPEWISHEDFDELLSGAIVFLKLFDASANNGVIDCIARQVPLLVNKLPAIAEYLGVDYPLYYRSLEEAGRMSQDDNLLMEAHNYLKRDEVQERVNLTTFPIKFSETQVYKAL
jgi:hypothetical protein